MNTMHHDNQRCRMHTMSMPVDACATASPLMRFQITPVQRTASHQFATDPEIFERKGIEIRVNNWSNVLPR